MSANDLFLGIDVGTGSARAGLFDEAGRLVATAKRPIRMWREPGEIVEQSSADIWHAICESVQEALEAAGGDPARVRGIGFDATCSLVAVGPGAQPLAVGPSNDPQRDIVVWMDHRALAQTERINATGHPVLAYVGGRISPEMETPKLLWLKENKPDTFHGAEHFFDLADYLTWRATGSAARSVCTITCKWTYLAHERRWDEDYFRTIGLGEFADEGFRRIGQAVLDIGEPVGAGLTAEAAADLGLKPGTPVGAALIDAHAGGVGTVSGVGRDLALIMGTSACAMAVTAEATFVEGVWGPYFGAMLPGAWLLEGGQSGYGAALDHLVGSHPGFAAAREAAEREGRGVLDHLEARAVALAGSVEAARLSATLHVVPDHLGNRSPHADPHATGTVSGLTLAADEDAIVRLFVAALCGLCYGTRDIVEAMRAKGVPLERIVVSGGASRSPLLRRILADATGTTVVLPETAEPVLLGSAMLGVVASGAAPDLAGAATRMCRAGETIEPAGGAIAAFHDAKFRAYRTLQAAERQVREAMATVEGGGAGRG
ncbi:FGGY-family carbohydrate kinase [Aureimonas phyllosphaerae]|uniref:D-ribulokinase n=1 Tax=Aureimonas phyllosphaerae TaxID=1166078 RepID=A0A7W6BQ40_9HYPH|nr:FGGY-family carbohydrate kinase [Aureimonas phyllosphaerae]MBB3936019.1 D-ribulokinase [Aureimonas phyllosphaerae]MBB3960256.1 D-ribulokinase [Aureimonas phyllosphaerae]SFF35590.1 D-ribulokinase [Aureimonas phyllosphaerae]